MALIQSEGAGPGVEFPVGANGNRWHYSSDYWNTTPACLTPKHQMGRIGPDFRWVTPGPHGVTRGLRRCEAGRHPDRSKRRPWLWRVPAGVEPQCIRAGEVYYDLLIVKNGATGSRLVGGRRWPVRY